MDQLKNRTLKLKRLYRSAPIQSGYIDDDKRTVDLSFSSETPCDRFFGSEILGHGPGEVDMSRLSDGAPLLDNHDPAKQIGVVDGARIQNGKGFATVRFSNTQAGQDVFRDVRDKIKRNVSVGYDPKKMVLISKSDDKNKVYRVTNWQPMEISIVSMPLDNSVGIGRAENESEFDVEIVDNPEMEERTDNIEQIIEDIDKMFSDFPYPKTKPRKTTILTL